MARAKPQYTGRTSLGEKPKDFSEGLRDLLRKFYPDKKKVNDDVWGHPADNFVNEILAAAIWAKSELYHMKSNVTVEESRLEHADLLQTLISAETKLRSISPDLDRLISPEAEPQGCADQIKQMIDHVKIAAPLLRRLLRARRPEQKKHLIAIEMTKQVMAVISQEDYGIPITAWVSSGNKNTTSKIIQILKLIGDDIGLEYDPQTWRRFIREAI